MSTFWSTHLMNFATWESIYGLFPFSTIVRKHICVLSSDKIIGLNEYDEFVKLGFKRESLISLWQKERSVGDEWTRRSMFSDVRFEPQPEFIRARFRIGNEGIQFLSTVELTDV
ncbi:hypothetical protein N7471_010452 [Penicillium samsonianum]|uniref:uncharacterized protein n=1 Tax=Penicillium samsonianum TaxID=1882272 RepID=UPI002547379B|nr:uncharacterized protein N7471_010452 [Penicillium samsonianum]KAJ6125959.1 hypothetical protein N7471_010452 [Penicillium samsonianum]